MPACGSTRRLWWRATRRTARPAAGLSLGELEAFEPRTAVIVRERAADAVFVSLWQFGERAETSVALRAAGKADGEIVLETTAPEAGTWVLPYTERAIQKR